MSDKELANKIVERGGGTGHIVSVRDCATRLAVSGYFCDFIIDSVYQSGAEDDLVLSGIEERSFYFI